VSNVADAVLPLVKEVLPLVEDPVTALLPETEGLFTAASQILGRESPPSNSAEREDQVSAQRLLRQLPKQKGASKQEHMTKILELLMDELERAE